MHAWLKEDVILGAKWIREDCLLQGKRVFFFFFDYAVMAKGCLDSNAQAGRYGEGLIDWFDDFFHNLAMN